MTLITAGCGYFSDDVVELERWVQCGLGVQGLDGDDYILQIIYRTSWAVPWEKPILAFNYFLTSEIRLQKLL